MVSSASLCALPAEPVLVLLGIVLLVLGIWCFFRGPEYTMTHVYLLGWILTIVGGFCVVYWGVVC